MSLISKLFSCCSSSSVDVIEPQTTTAPPPPAKPQPSVAEHHQADSYHSSFHGPQRYSWDSMNSAAVNGSNHATLDKMIHQAKESGCGRMAHRLEATKHYGPARNRW